MIGIKKTATQLLFTSFVVGTTMHFDKELTVKADYVKNPTVKDSKNVLSNSSELKFSDRGNDVLQLQTLLMPFQYYQGLHDGIYGLLTRQAVRTYQKQHGLTVDGIVGPITMSHLRTHDKIIQAPNQRLSSSITITENNPDTAILSSTSHSYALHPKLILKQGDRNVYVKQLQLKLKEYGYYNGVDGIYGPKTRAAVISYQKAHHLLVDGIAGPQTIRHMLGNEEIIEYHEVKESEKIVKEHTETTTHNTSDIISIAKNYLNTPYVWGGTTPRGFDCSGFIQYVYKQTGYTISRTVQEIWNQANPIQERQVGDLVFFQTYQAGPSHMGIYLGNNEFIHVSSSQGVTISDLNNSYWSPRYLGAKRIP